jgi:hypothetical protein
MTDTRPMPANLLNSLHSVIDKYRGGFASMKQRRFLLAMLAKHSSTTILAEDEQSRSYVVTDATETAWGFTCHRRYGSCLERQLLDTVGLTLDEGQREAMRILIGWGPSETTWEMPASVAEVIAEGAKLEAEAVAMTRNARPTWSAEDLTMITRIQIAAKGLLAEIGDNAGTSPMAMSAADAHYVSQMLTAGHIRNAHMFQRKSMTEPALRRACIVNLAKLDEATAALATRMVLLMNASAARLGRPVTFAEYTAQMTA